MQTHHLEKEDSPMETYWKNYFKPEVLEELFNVCGIKRGKIMNFNDLTDHDLAVELVTRSRKNSVVNDEDKRSINEMTWAMDGSPKIRACLEQLLGVVLRLSSESEFNKSVLNALELNAVITHYNGLYAEKRLERIEKHLGIEINFEE